MIYGLQKGRDDWFIEQLPEIEKLSPEVIDGLSISFKGVDRKLKPVVELHGNVTSEQLRKLADAIENVPKSS